MHLREAFPFLLIHDGSARLSGSEFRVAHIRNVFDKHGSSSRITVINSTICFIRAETDFSAGPDVDLSVVRQLSVCWLKNDPTGV